MRIYLGGTHEIDKKKHAKKLQTTTALMIFWKKTKKKWKNEKSADNKAPFS